MNFKTGDKEKKLMKKLDWKTISAYNTLHLSVIVVPPGSKYIYVIRSASQYNLDIIRCLSSLRSDVSEFSFSLVYRHRNYSILGFRFFPKFTFTLVIFSNLIIL